MESHQTKAVNPVMGTRPSQRLENVDRAPDVVFARCAIEAQSMVRTLTDRAGRRGRVRGRAVGFALDRARQLAGVRELPKFDLVLVLG